MYLKRTALCSALLGLTASVYLMAAPTVKPVVVDSVKANALLLDARAETTELKTDAETLDRYGRSDVTWESYATVLDRIKDHVNRTGKIVSKLLAVRSECAPWQQEAVDRILPVLNDLAYKTDAMMSDLKTDRLLVHRPAFHEFAANNSVLAAKLADIVASYVDYGKSRAKLSPKGVS